MMNKVFVKLKQRQGNKFKKMLSVEEDIYQDKNSIIETVTEYVAGALLEDGEWFEIKDFSQQEYYLNDLLEKDLDSVDFDSLSKQDFDKIDYLFVKKDKYIYFQNIPKSRLVKKKRIGCFGEVFKYNSESNEIIINDFPDAIYEKDTDTLFFHRLESITSIFSGIDQLYKEATAKETSDFLENDFITLKDGYTSDKVKTANRKRIALASQTLNGLTQYERNNIFSYIGEYCPKLKANEKSFDVSSEEDLKLLLFGIEQRFYTTIVGGEKRIANSVTTFNKGEN
ncbi:MAG: hypothetical protein RR531_13185, partial [Longicatena sp.]